MTIRRPTSMPVTRASKPLRLTDGEVIAGSLPKKAARLVRQWALDHQAELQANWQRGVDLLPMEMIPGADLDD